MQRATERPSDRATDRPTDRPTFQKFLTKCDFREIEVHTIGSLLPSYNLATYHDSHGTENGNDNVAQSNRELATRN